VGQRLALLLVAATSLTGCITVNLGGARARGPLEEVVVTGEGSAKVAVVDLSGTILTETRSGPLGVRVVESLVDRVQRQLDRAKDDRDVKAVVLRVNSPGGTVTASDVLYQAVRRFKEEKKVPIVSSFLTVAASGGYYVAMATDEVLAHPTTITGSIGVIVSSVSIYGLYEKLGLAAYTLKSGRYKDIGSPTRPPTADELALLQQTLVDASYARFLSVVQAGRPKLAPEEIRRLADGRIYNAEQARSAGLVDGVGYMRDAVDAAKRRAGVPQARVVFYVRPGAERPTHLYATADAPEPAATLAELLAGLTQYGTPELLYLWPGF
jgi:protease-4